MDICRYIKTNRKDSIPESLWISESEWQDLILKSKNLVHFSEWKGVEETPRFINKAVLVKEGLSLAELKLFKGNIHVYYDKTTPKLLVELSMIADNLKAYFLINESKEYPKSVIDAARKKVAKRTNQKLEEYQKKSFGGNNMWLTVKGESADLIDFFKLKIEAEKSWNEGLEDMHDYKGMFMYSFRGWVFLAGQKVDWLFSKEGIKGEAAIEEHHVDTLLEIGKQFSDVQLFMFYNRSMYFNAFYRVLNGQMLYGQYYTESYEKEYGKMPKAIKDLHDSDANTVASEWSYDPDYLRFCKELENAKVFIVNAKEFESPK